MIGKYELGILLIFIVKIVSKDKMKMVISLSSHGASSPSNIAKVDKLGFEWPGREELSSVGMRQQFLFGTHFRARYVDQYNFFDSHFNISQMSIVSTNQNRTILSAYSQILGLYPPSTGPEISLNQTVNARPPIKVENLNVIEKELQLAAIKDRVQVFPVHTLEEPNYVLDLYKTENCKALKEYYDSNKKKLSTFYSEFNKTYYSTLKSVLKYDDSNYWFNFRNVFTFFDTLNANLADGKSMDQLTKVGVNMTDLRKQLEKFELLYYFTVLYGDSDEHVAKMVSSPLMGDIIKYFRRRVNEDGAGLEYDGTFSPKFISILGTRELLASALVYLKNFCPKLSLKSPAFSSSLVFELYENDEEVEPLFKQFKVKVFYNDDVVFENNFNDFLKSVYNINIENAEIEDFCGLKVNSSEEFYIIIIIVLSCVIALLLILIVVLLIKRKYATQYTRLNEEQI